MDIFEFALEKEKSAENYYREYAGKLKNQGLKRIMLLLADEESAHYEAIKEMRKGNLDIDVDASTNIIEDSISIFQEMRNNKNSLIQENISIKEILKEAQRFEEKSRIFYEQKAYEIKDSARKDIFISLADLERKHFILLENIIEFIEKPDTWLENAEFTKLEDY